MLKTLLIIAIGILPSLLSLWLVRKAQQRTRSRLRYVARNLARVRIRESSINDGSDRHYLEGVGFLIGDITCQFNARSAHLRCAVNPSGPCEGCRYYEPRKITEKEE